jgi:predicted dehydrogenase
VSKPSFIPEALPTESNFKETHMMTRREFTGKAAAVAGLAIASSAKSYAQIVGANDRVNFAVMGVHGRGYAHLSALKANAQNARLAYACDVESNFLAKFAADAEKELGYKPATEWDFRKALERKDIDAISIAVPDHWHAPMAILGVEAGKHVYLEKPCSYDPNESRILLAAQEKYGKLIQIGSQQRSSPHTIKIVGDIHNGLIGTTYLAEAWYVNRRGSIGIGKEAPVPATLDWDLFQGPAPRRPYHDNYQPYNWHWFKVWGTGETLNNGSHEVDVCRWALGVDYPNSVEAAGGRYAYKDDWEFYDTLSVSWKYDDKMITWSGRSCNPLQRYGSDRGSLIFGSVLVNRDGYVVYDLSGKAIDEFKATKAPTSSTDVTGKDSMTDAHFGNLIAGIQRGEKLHAPLEIGMVGCTMLQLANYAWETKRSLKLDAANHGRIVDDPAALALTKRDYQKGWEPKI